MLFNSFAFLFAFLPLALALTYGLRRWLVASKLALILLSLGFYAWWSLGQVSGIRSFAELGRSILFGTNQLPILLWSIGFNYWVGRQIQSARAGDQPTRMRIWLTFGVVADLALLGWYKYANFVVENLNAALGVNIGLARIALPLAISFFTFQKLAYLIDSARGEAKPMRLLDFSLFAAFFPQLISGPIVHYKEVVPQLLSRQFAKYNGRNIMVGLVILAIGLFKKTVIADSLATYADPIFNHDVQLGRLDLATELLAAITFSFQLYFDFSGYSDMAIGLGRLFGVRLPLNFHSPLRAPSIIEYWRRWHMTLQRFIYAYIFQPLTYPLTRFAAERGLAPWPSFALAVALPLFITFVAVGIWHGAGWTYVAYGVMQAVYVCTNQFYRELRLRRRRALRKENRTLDEPGRAHTLLFQAITLLAVLFSNVMFRARALPDALTIWCNMVGLHAGPQATGLHVAPWLLPALAVSAGIVFLAPNTQQIMRRFGPAQNWDEWKSVAPPILSWSWKPSAAGLLFAGLTLFLGVIFIERGQGVFLYFNF